MSHLTTKQLLSACIMTLSFGLRTLAISPVNKNCEVKIVIIFVPINLNMLLVLKRYCSFPYVVVEKYENNFPLFTIGRHVRTHCKLNSVDPDKTRGVLVHVYSIGDIGATKFVQIIILG